MNTAPLLRLVGLNQAYGQSRILSDIDLDIAEGSCTCVMGRNGVGKTTLMRTIMGQLAARAGFPRAARAVGHCMALNRIALVIPCHRVLAAGGRLGGYSASGGIRLKRRLLRMEASPLI